MRLRFHIGGPAFHPVAEQASAIERWLGAGFQCEQRDGVDAFDDLDRVDLLILMGLHWTGMTADWAGKLAYRPMTDAQKASFEAYVRSGRPILAHHGGVASYDDWPRFGQLVGVSWVWNFTSHSPFGRYRMRALDTGHPVVEGVGEYELEDEIYYALALNGDMAARVHAGVEYEGVTRPMVITAEGGRVAGAGKLVYLANGHDMRAFACPAMQTLWCNAVRWLVR
jgi:type 1 glutamine amidotransferase